jgi:hypothetical protein
MNCAFTHTQGTPTRANEKRRLTSLRAGTCAFLCSHGARGKFALLYPCCQTGACVVHYQSINRGISSANLIALSRHTLILKRSKTGSSTHPLLHHCRQSQSRPLAAKMMQSPFQHPQHAAACCPVQHNTCVCACVCPCAYAPLCVSHRWRLSLVMKACLCVLNMCVFEFVCVCVRESVLHNWSSLPSRDCSKSLCQHKAACCLSVTLPVRVCMYVCLCVYVRMSVCVCVTLPVCVCVCVCDSACHCLCVWHCLSVTLPVCMCVCDSA